MDPRASSRTPASANQRARSDDHDSHRGPKRPIMESCYGTGPDQMIDGGTGGRSIDLVGDLQFVCRFILADRKIASGVDWNNTGISF